MVTIQQIADALSLSTTTVSRAISGKGRVSEKTRLLVKNYIDSVGYQPNAIAQGLAQSKSFSLALIIPKDINASCSFFFYECILGICEVAESSGYNIIVVTSDEDSYTSYEHLIQKRKVDGLILTRLYDDDMAVSHLISMKIPFLVIGEANDERVTEVCNNYIEASKTLTSYFLDSGSRRILFIEGDAKHKISQSRESGFTAAFESSVNNSAKSHILRNMKSETDIEMHLPRTLQQFHPDAVIASDDVLCEWALPVITHMNYRIPHDIRVASCIDSQLLQRHTPAITAIDINTTLLAKTAGKVLIDQLEGRKYEQKTIVPYSILLRESTKKVSIHSEKLS